MAKDEEITIKELVELAEKNGFVLLGVKTYNLMCNVIFNLREENKNIIKQRDLLKLKLKEKTK